MASTPLGKLKSVNVREVWSSEPRDFTRWLSEPEHLELLGEALGLQLEFVAREQVVGSFAADIVARVVGRQSTVLIENQLESTDHRHLGQIITYAAGLRASTMVWVAPDFREEHRAAVDWLNQVSSDGTDFFAVQIEAYRIGDSLPAPRFNVVAKPNAWTKKVASTSKQLDSELSDSQKRWRDYWSGLQSAASGRFDLVVERATATGNWQQILSISKGKDLWFAFNLYASRGGLRVELYIDRDLAKQAFEQLQANKADIEGGFGSTLTWEALPGARASRVCAYMPGSIGANHEQPNDQYDWLITMAPRFISVFRPTIDNLSVQKLAAIDRDETETGGQMDLSSATQ